MKKKLLPYILGCSMMALLPLAANADTYYHVGTDITNGTDMDVPDSTNEPDLGDGHNEFTEYNDGSTTNTLAKTFGTPKIADNTVNWLDNNDNPTSVLGNTRNTTAMTQQQYPVELNNEKQDYRKNHPGSENQGTTLAEDLVTYKSDFTEENTNDVAGTTDLETAIPEYDMTIPAKTVLPIGATKWRLGNVKIDGNYFVRPDKVKLQISKTNFHGPGYDGSKAGGEQNQDNLDKVIAFDVTDGVNNTSVVGAENCKYFFQTGTNDNDLATFPHAYKVYTSNNYEDGKVSTIKETHQVWLIVDASQWTGKVKGQYSGNITFDASVVTDDTASMYGDRSAQSNPYYPGEPNPNP